MKCTNCGTDAGPEAKFCGQCGHEIKDMRSSGLCSRCGEDNDPGARFCHSCGSPLSAQNTPIRTKKRKKKKNRHQRRERDEPVRSLSFRGLTDRPVLLILSVAFAAVVIIAGYDALRPGSSSGRPYVTENKTQDPGVESTVMAVASRFICSCGTCGEQPLESCTCQTAVAERQMIRERVLAGQSVDQVTVAVATIYGWPKPQYAKDVQEIVDRQKPGAQSSYSAAPVGAPSIASKVVATAFDVNEVYSHFQCPCGQCGIDELLYCECSHPRGAKEVKKFVLDLVGEKTYTVEQLIAAVDSKYGSRKF